MSFWRKQPQTSPAQRRRFADLQAMPPEQRRAALASPEAATWIEAAARYGLVEAQHLWGQSLLQTDPALAFRWLSGAAASGYLPAVNLLGRCFEKGWGTPANTAMAAAHYRAAAAQGHDWAQFNLASLLLYGLGVPRDRAAAYRWYERAARQGHAKAMNMLGRFHEEAWDRPPDLHRAASWYGRAAEAGDYRGQFNLATILAQAGQTARAVHWFTAALAAGNPDFRAEACKALEASANPAYRDLGRHARPPQRSRRAPDQCPA